MLAGAGCAGTQPHPGVLRVAIAAEPKSLNPLLASTTVDGFINRLMFEPLLSADPRGNPVPMLAAVVPSMTNGGVSRDGLTVTYHLRPNARWSDGVPVTSRDVAFSWRALMNPNNNVITRHGYDMVAAVETPDPHTVVVHLRRRFAPFVNTFFAESDQPYDVVPAHLLAGYPNLNHVPFNGAPAVGDGPFVFRSWQRGDRVVADANPGFFMGRPALQRVVIEFVPDENTAVNLLRTHAIDYFFQPTIAIYPALANIAGSKLVWVNVNGYEALAFNLSHPATGSRLVRLAIAHALDKDALVAHLTHGREQVATADLPDWMWAFDPNVKSYPYDPSKARALLQQAGYTFGADGMASKNGVPLRLLLATETGNATHREESLLIQDALRRIGIAVEIKEHPLDLMYATAAMGGVVQGGKFDLTLAPWFSGIDPDDSSQFSCDQVPPHGYNTTRYCDPAMDRAQQDALNRYDIAMRSIAYAHSQRLLARDVPAIFFWWQRQPEAIADEFEGFAPNPVTESWNAWQWRLKPRP